MMVVPLTIASGLTEVQSIYSPKVMITSGSGSTKKFTFKNFDKYDIYTRHYQLVFFLFLALLLLNNLT
jgi:hypothetical protein